MDRDWKKLGPRESDKHWNRVEQALLRPEELSFYPALNRLNLEKNYSINKNCSTDMEGPVI